MTRDRFQLMVGPHVAIIDVPSDLITGTDALAFAQRLRSIADNMERIVRIRDSLARAPSCGCPSCTAKRAGAN